MPDALNEVPRSRIWAWLVLRWCRQLGVREVCIAPGSRSTPLLLAAVEMGFNLQTHFDERGLGFFALGLSKSVKRPVALITTSGSAVANLAPAAVEANQTGVPLIFLTGDRPPELHHCGANQSIEQENLLAQCTRAHVNIPPFDASVSLKDLLDWLAPVFDQTEKGPVHINMMFREPFYPDSDPGQPLPSGYLDEMPDYQRHANEDGQTVSGEAFFGEPITGKWVVVALDGAQGAHSEIRQLCQQTCAVLIADVQSGLMGATGVLGSADRLFRNEPFVQALSQADVVLQLGSRPVSKRLTHWLAGLPPGKLRIVARDEEPTNIGRNVHWHWRVSVRMALRWWLDHTKEDDAFRGGWLTRPLEKQTPVSQTEPDKDWTEIEWLRCLQTRLLEKAVDPRWFAGNSLPVRLLDTFSVDRPGQESGWSVTANRGASGIDGLIATFAGWVKGQLSSQNSGTIGLIGDLSALHDLNSLVLLRELPGPWVLVIINNDGGGIFNWLPVPDRPDIQPLYQVAHGMQFEGICAQAGLAYTRSTPTRALADRIVDTLRQGKTGVFELVTDAGRCHDRWMA